MILELSPNVQRKIWGGNKLEKMKNLSHDASAIDGIGETWEISIHPDGPSLVNEQNLTINKDQELPYLVKLIDTSDELSVQVHPGDEYARVHENSQGKSECWIILEADKGAGIYLGLREGVTKESFLKGLNDKERMNEFLNFYEVKKGDFFFVPAGSIHAIGKGITLAEVQQSSGITYRVWDWNRVDSKGNPRELHVKKSLDVINFNPEYNTKEFFEFKEDLFVIPGKTHILSHNTFSLSVVNLKQGEKLILDYPKKKRLSSILTLNSQVKINGLSLASYKAVVFGDEPRIEIQALTDSSFILID